MLRREFNVTITLCSDYREELLMAHIDNTVNVYSFIEQLRNIEDLINDISADSPMAEMVEPLEAGGVYVTASGEKVRVSKRLNASSQYIFSGDNGLSYLLNGREYEYTHNRHDIVKKYVAPETHPKSGEYWMDRSGNVHLIDRITDNMVFPILGKVWNTDGTSFEANTWTMEGKFYSNDSSPCDLIKQVIVMPIEEDTNV